MKSIKQIVGIMSGTSVDGVDYVLVENRDGKIYFKDQAGCAFPKKLRARILSAASGKCKSWELAELDFDLGRFYSDELAKIKKSKGWQFDLVGLHGQTVYHRGQHCTYQIGESSFIAADHNVPVVSDFRSLDIAYGGHGAPLATFFHKEVIGAVIGEVPFAFQNLGGIGNVTFVGTKQNLSFDTGPANMLIDYAVTKITKGKSTFDKDSKFSQKGIPELGLVSKWIKNAIYSKKPPKSLGREQFGEKYFNACWSDLAKTKTIKGYASPSKEAVHSGKKIPAKNLKIKIRPEDKVATFVELTAVSVADAYKRHLPEMPKVVVIGGGGAKNPYLLKRIQYNLPNTKVMTSDALGWPVDSIEGAAFALLALKRWSGEPNVLSETTGSRQSASLGKITTP